MALDKLVHAQGITVTAAGVARSLSEVVHPVDVLGGEDLVLRKQSTLGETLAQQPGVTASTYGQGSSRPVIRGLGQDRIRILENGLDTGDVSSIGPDHSVAMDPLTAEQIEVVRGPAAVLWGANAIGGVVNVLDGRVPDRPAARIGGRCRGTRVRIERQQDRRRREAGRWDGSFRVALRSLWA